MTRFLLDANLSPKTAHYLSAAFDLDVVSLLAMRLGELPDHEVMRMARSACRVIIALDEDFTRPYDPTGRPRQGVIYLDLPNTHRDRRSVNQILAAFFRTQAASIDLERSLVVITEREVHVIHQEPA